MASTHASSDPEWDADAIEAIRIDLPISLRLFIAPAAAGVLGFTTGLLSASSLASLQFLAENAHRQPTTIQGWYFYQKTKNYRVLFAGLKGGAKTGSKLAAWTAGFVGLQEATDRLLFSRIDQVRPAKRSLSGAAAGTALAAAATSIYRLGPRGTPRRLAIGLSIGLVAGLAEDVKGMLRLRAESAEPVAIPA